MTVDMSELHGNEKYYYSLSKGLSDSVVQSRTIRTGDLMLLRFQFLCGTYFMKPFPLHNYTRLGTRKQILFRTGLPPWFRRRKCNPLK